MLQQGQLSTAMEDYLEAIYRLCEEGAVARVRDIANAVGVSRPTVSGALKKLGQMELVNYQPYEVVTLTPEGAEVAKRVNRRHEILSRFFRAVLGVPDDTADVDACRLEHGLSTETVDRLIAFMEFLENCPRVGSDWIEHFHGNCTEKLKPKSCLRCIEAWFPEARTSLAGKRDRSRGEDE